MKREPTITVRLTDLISLLSDMGHSVNKSDLFKRIQPFQIKDRVAVVANKRQIKKAEKTRLNVDVAKFNLTLYTEREKAGHRNIRTIKTTDSIYGLLKEIASDAVEFSELFNLSIDTGYQDYIKIGLGLMGKRYATNKFKYYKDKIFSQYEFFTVINEDEHRPETNRFLAIYNAKLKEETGVEQDFSNDMKRYVDVIYGRMEADENGADYDDWIQGQFDGLQFLDSVPETSQLSGDNARHRWKTYLKERGKEKVKKGRQADETEEEYLKRIRNA